MPAGVSWLAGLEGLAPKAQASAQQLLTWRRDSDHEQRMLLSKLRIRQIDARTKQIENETEQLRKENARGRQRLASIDALCFPPES
jgi:hypothetical protein